MTIKFALNKNEVDSNKKLAKALADKFKVQSAIAEEKKGRLRREAWVQV